MIDLRSDTVTLPTRSMRQAMANAVVGDDVWDEDPTIHELQEKAADMVGKEASLFVPSGTMGNLCALLSHTQAGDEAIVEVDSHMFQAEVAGGARVAGVQLRPIETEDGHIRPDQVREAIREPDIHHPRTALLCLENTHNKKGGICLTAAETGELADVAHQAGFPVHLDGARVFNASVAQGVDVKELTGPVDSVMFCLSKGLSAPVGSVVAGSHRFVEQARRARKLLGGGMRQAGVIAAAGLCALQEMVDRLAEDHANARRLAVGLSRLNRFDIDMDRVQTNMVYFDCRLPVTAAALEEGCRKEGLLIDRVGRLRVRLVTHWGVDEAAVDRAVEILSSVTDRLTTEL